MPRPKRDGASRMMAQRANKAAGGGGGGQFGAGGSGKFGKSTGTLCNAFVPLKVPEMQMEAACW